MMRKRNTRGSSLLEVLSAISLFSLVASGVGALAIGSIRQTTVNRHGTAAAMLAQQRLEELRGLDYAQVLPYSTTATVNGLTYTVSHSVLENNPAAGMKTITATVSWNGPGGAKSYAVRTIFTSISAG
jgi:type II secretory pathway pseudopilin PulG